MAITSYVKIFESLATLYQSAPEKFSAERERLFNEFLSDMEKTDPHNIESLQNLRLLLSFKPEESKQDNAISESLHLLSSQCSMLFSKLDALNELTNKFPDKRKQSLEKFKYSESSSDQTNSLK